MANQLQIKKQKHNMFNNRNCLADPVIGSVYFMQIIQSFLKLDENFVDILILLQIHL